MKFHKSVDLLLFDHSVPDSALERFLVDLDKLAFDALSDNRLHFFRLTIFSHIPFFQNSLILPFSFH